MKIIDAFIFYNEIDLLYYRLSLLYDVVDFFIIVEATRTFMGKEKPLYYRLNEQKFSKFKEKIIHIVVKNLKHNPDVNKNEQWLNEYTQRNFIDNGIGLLNLNNEDIILIGDVDEIPRRDMLINIKNFNFHILCLEQDFYYYNLNTLCRSKWYASVILKYEYYRINPVPNIYRNNPLMDEYEKQKPYDNISFIRNAGWHLSYFGDTKSIINKIQNFSHQENNIEKYISEEKIRDKIKNSIDLFDRNSMEFDNISIENNRNLPECYELYLSKFYESNKSNKSNVAFFVRHFSERGTEVSIYDYAHYNEDILGNKSIIVYLNEESMKSLNFPILTVSFEKFKKRFGDNMIEIKTMSDMAGIIEKYEIDVFYTLTHGGSDIYDFGNKNIWGKCKTIKHCNFNLNYPEGDYYITINNSLNKNRTNYPVIPHIISLPSLSSFTCLRSDLNIPDNAIVFGRYGGFKEFNIDYVYEAIKNVLLTRDDIYFLFMNTDVFYSHSNIIYLDRNIDTDYKVKFINTCDAMLHAREEGETFGMSIGEFSFMNKPVITTISKDNNAHLDILGNQAIIYTNYYELVNILKNFKYIIEDRKDFDAYKKFSPEYVMNLLSVYICKEKSMPV